jgi:hypothetical protein
MKRLPSREERVAAGFVVVEVLPTPGTIDKFAVGGSGSDFAVQSFECVHDIVKTHSWDRGGTAKIRGVLNSRGIRGPRSQDGPLLLDGKLRISDDIHRIAEGAGRMEEAIEFKVLSVFCISHGHIPK